MAGICAALASARHGARTALVHDRHVLGGNASSEIRMHICGASENLAKPELEESGILHEIMLDNKSRNDYFNYSIWDMVLFTAVKSQPHLTVYLSTAMEDCRMEGNEIREIDAYQLTTETHWRSEGTYLLTVLAMRPWDIMQERNIVPAAREGQNSMNRMRRNRPTMTVWEIRCYSRRWTEDIR